MTLFFGVQIEPQFGYTFSEMNAILDVAEESQFTHAWFSDHFMLDENATTTVAHEVLVSMMNAVVQTRTLRVGSLVLSNSYRYPSVLAKTLASLDQFSKGRLEIGYGAGWKELEYNAYGIPYPKPGERIKQMSEGIQVMKALWTQEKASFTGTYYSLHEAICYPKPYQQPHPPIWVGTMYAKAKMLRLAAEHGDGINIAWSMPVSEYALKKQVIEKHLEEIGRDPSSFKYSLGLWTRIYADEHEKIQVMTKIAKKRNMTLEQYKERVRGALHGTIEEIREKLKAYVKIGITHFIFMFPYTEEITYIKLMDTEILPKLH